MPYNTFLFCVPKCPIYFVHIYMFALFKCGVLGLDFLSYLPLRLTVCIASVLYIHMYFHACTFMYTPYEQRENHLHTTFHHELHLTNNPLVWLKVFSLKTFHQINRLAYCIRVQNNSRPSANFRTINKIDRAKC